MSRGRFVLAVDSSLRSAVKVAAGAADALRRPATGVVVLLYHRVGRGTSSSVDLPAALFERQMATLASSHTVVSMDYVMRCLSGTEPIEPCVAVTFDDGTSDLVEVALPILERHSIPSTWYIATSFVDEQQAFDGAGSPLTWQALRDACSTGHVSIGSHTHTHLLLDRAPVVEVVDELDRSIESIGANIGSAPLDFAYPKAVLGSRAAQEEVRARFRSAALAGTRANVVGHADPYRLARSPIQANDGLGWFMRKARGGMGLEDALRERLNRRRYARAIS